MTPGRLYLLALLCLVLAGFLLFGAADSGLASLLGALATVLAIVAYLFGLYLNRVGRRGEAALTALRSRVASVTEAAIREEHRVYHLEGLSELAQGGLIVFYTTADQGWLLVPLMQEMAWLRFTAEGVSAAEIETDHRGLHLHLVLKTEEGRGLDLRLASTLVDPKVGDARDAARDLRALESALSVPLRI